MIAPVHRLNYYTLIQCYTIDRNTNYNFLIVTLSRLFYYCGMSIQTFFLYYIHDIIQIPPHENPETIVAILAMIGQCSGAMTCYPVGMISDRLLHGRRKPFIYIACIILAAATFSFIYARTVHHVIILSTILGAANGMYLTAETSLAVDTLTTEATNNTNQNCHETSTNENNANNINRVNHSVAGTAQLLGIWGVAAFVGSALGPLIGGPLLEAFGTTTTAVVNNATSSLHQGSSLMHHPSDVTVTELTATSMAAYTITGYTVILSLSSFYFVCSAVILQYIKVNKKESTDSEVSETTI
jgi:MFS family permease